MMLKKFINLLKGKHWCPKCDGYSERGIRTCWSNIPASGIEDETRTIECIGKITVCEGCHTYIEVKYTNVKY